MKNAKIKSLTTGKKLIQIINFKNFSLFTFHFSLLVSLLLFCFSLNAPAQVKLPADTAPPPLKIISKQEKTTLEAETNISDRTKLSLELMEARLKKAEDFNAQNEFTAMFEELGGFHALVDNTLNFLKRNDTGSEKVLNNYKRLEMSLRKFAPRLELIRRELPIKYESYVRGLIKTVREARSKAVEPLFGDSVVPNNQLSDN